MSFLNYSEYNAYLALKGFDPLVEYGISSKMMEHRILRLGLEEKEPEKVHFLRTEVYPVMNKYQKNFDFRELPTAKASWLPGSSSIAIRRWSYRLSPGVTFRGSRGRLLQNIDCCIDIPIMDCSTDRTLPLVHL